MKVLVTTSGTDLNAPMDNRFGRARTFLVYDTDTETFDVVDNQQNLNAAQGAGVQAAQAAAQLGVQAVVTAHCGPKAFRVLQAAGVKVFTTDARTVAEALAQFRDGKLREAETADVEGHWT